MKCVAKNIAMELSARQMRPEPILIDNQTVRGADYTHLLQTFVRGEAPKFPSN